MKVSVIVPCYNCQDYIVDTLKSLVNQTYKEIEIICVNDGSKDNTIHILNKWKKESSVHFEVITQINAGVSSARNTGIKYATGTHIMFCDSDDLLHPAMIERLVNAITYHKADTSYCFLSRNKQDVFADENKVTEKSGELVDILSAMNTLLYRMGEIGFYCFLYEKEKLIQNNICFDDDIKYGEDREFNWKYLAICKNAAVVNAPLYWYRPNNNSATKKKSTWDKTHAIIATRRASDFLSSKNSLFHDEFEKYMTSRVIWSVAKDFSLNGGYALFKRLIKEYEVKQYMKITTNDKSFLVRLASRLFLINPRLFYISIHLFGGFVN